VEKVEGQVSIQAEINGSKETFTAEKVLVSVGRQANVENMGIENTDILVEKGFTQATNTFQTKESHIYATGDVPGGMQPAH
ncbi:FAD-dependent oxidoreductase, partial [Planococcus sp. SIMBA_143]